MRGETARVRSLVPAVLLLAALTGCGGGDGDDAEAAPAPSPSASPSDSPSADPTAICGVVSGADLSRLLGATLPEPEGFVGDTGNTNCASQTEGLPVVRVDFQVFATDNTLETEATTFDLLDPPERTTVGGVEALRYTEDSSDPSYGTMRSSRLLLVDGGRGLLVHTSAILGPDPAAEPGEDVSVETLTSAATAITETVLEQW